MSKGRSQFPGPVIKLLFGKAANHCCLCKIEIAEAPEMKGDKIAVIGEIAHIASFSKDSGPRANPALTDAERQDYENLVVLCANCHTKIDRQELKYTAEEILEKKRRHEESVTGMFRQYMPTVGFKELEHVTKWLVEESNRIQDISIPPSIQAKIEKNNLSDSSREKIIIGTLKAQEVERFISTRLVIDESFSEKLRCGFIERYAFLKRNAYNGDELFEALHLFSHNNSSDYKYMTAGLAVLVYLFQKCEVFER